jgi:hypothetical protein
MQGGKYKTLIELRYEYATLANLMRGVKKHASTDAWVTGIKEGQYVFSHRAKHETRLMMYAFKNLPQTWIKEPISLVHVCGVYQGGKAVGELANTKQ